MSEPEGRPGDILTRSLADIVLAIHDVDEYLLALRQIVRERYSYLTDVLAAIRNHIGDSPPGREPLAPPVLLRILGYWDDKVISLIDREWYDSEQNKFDVLVNYLEARGVLGSFQSAFVWALDPQGSAITLRGVTRNPLLAQICRGLHFTSEGH